MTPQLDRRAFLQMSTAATAGLALPAVGRGQGVTNSDKLVRVGIVGVGGRGSVLLRILLSFPSVQVRAVCDINRQHLERATETVVKAGQARPDGYAQGDEAYRLLMQRDDLDAVVIATPWAWHTPMAVAGMRAGKYVVGTRMKRSGMRWSRQGSQTTLSLRVAWMNEQWDRLWAQHPLAA